MINPENLTNFEHIKHVAIIMDGNGRWAKSRGLPRIEGHRKGVENVRQVMRTSRQVGIRQLSLYAFSVENWKRPAAEVNALMNLLDLFLRKHINELIENEVRLNVIGRPEELPTKVQAQLAKARARTEHFEKFQLNLALNYGSRTEVIDAVKKYTEASQRGEEALEDLDWERFSEYLYTRAIPDPDLVIRTSGESRMSNFLLMQCAYSELYFSPVHWPDFDREQYIIALESFNQRERRFGKTGEQIKTQSA